MSTRSFIATRTDAGLVGVYHHWDGYPTALADTLLRLYRTSEGDLAGMRKVLLEDHPAGFSTINNAVALGDFEDAGFTEYSSRTEGRTKRDVECYCHGDRSEAAQVITCRCLVGEDAGCDPLFLEWGYVLDEDGLTVLKSVPTGRTETVEGPRGPYEMPRYVHVEVGKLRWDLDADEAPLAVKLMEENGGAAWEAADAAAGRS